MLTLIKGKKIPKEQVYWENIRTLVTQIRVRTKKLHAMTAIMPEMDKDRGELYNAVAGQILNQLDILENGGDYGIAKIK